MFTIANDSDSEIVILVASTASESDALVDECKIMDYTHPTGIATEKDIFLLCAHFRLIVAR